MPYHADIEQRHNIMMLQCAEVYDSVLQCVAVCCSVLQYVAVCCWVLQCVAVCYSVLQCVAVCCNVSHCVAACCSVLQRVAACRTMRTLSRGAPTQALAAMLGNPARATPMLLTKSCLSVRVCVVNQYMYTW